MVVELPPGITVDAVSSSNASVLTLVPPAPVSLAPSAAASLAAARQLEEERTVEERTAEERTQPAATSAVSVSLLVQGSGRARAEIRFSDGSLGSAHFKGSKHGSRGGRDASGAVHHDRRPSHSHADHRL